MSTVNKKIDPALIGHELLKRSFKDWFLYVFRVIEGHNFIVDPIHEDMFNFFQDLIDGKKKRCILNIPPRAGKTTLAKYFLIYGITKNAKSNFIYCSYSQSLLNTIAQEVRDILENPIYKALFPNNMVVFDEEEANPIDDYWLSYLKQETGKNTYSTKKITTYGGGTCLFSSMGASITGFGFSTRAFKGFSGALIIDDPQKMADIHSKVLKKKCLLYFEETLLSRANNPTAPIVCIQQRAAKDDLSGYLQEKYNFYTLKKPLLNQDGVCQIPSQYTEERIKELQVNNYMFQSQYQQEPILEGGNIIKREWFKYYPIDVKYDYKKIVITGDTAITAKEHSDFTAFIVGGVTNQGCLHVLGLAHDKWEYPQLKKELVKLYNSWQFDKRTTSCSAVYVEDKASGQQLIQELKVKTNLPIRPIEVTKDKLTRVEEVLDYIASGLVHLPVSENYGFNPLILNECSEFSRDMSHAHDDIVDTLVHLINVTIAHREVSILDVL